MKSYKYIFCLLLIPAFSPNANACSVTIQQEKYINIITMHGPEIKGLRWERFNVLFYEGSERISLSSIKDGKVFEIAKWDKGKICFNDGPGECYSNTFAGVDLAASFGWIEQSNSKKDFKAIKDKIKVQIADSEEIEYTFKNRRARNTNKELFQELYAKWANAVCEAME